ncbi:MAG TPA: tetratricopeptide repeat protein [Tepidisphaeraceae bacterium]|nr:tetratricopeptide repeat protein [Tepidisphaeraceae bacterium]
MIRLRNPVHEATPSPSKAARRVLLAIFAGLLMALSARAGLAKTSTTQPTPAEYAQQLKAAKTLEALAYQTKKVADYRAAAAALEACSKIHPEDMVLQRSLGYLYLEILKEPNLAYPHLLAVYTANPTAPGWGDMLAAAANQTGRRGLEIKVLTDLTLYRPTDPWVRVELATALAKAGRFGDADKVYQDALKIAPNELWVNIDYAYFLLGRGRGAEAQLIAQKTLLAHPGSPDVVTLLNQIHQTEFGATKAQAEFANTTAVDRSYYATRAELSPSRAPEFKSTYYLFQGTDHFYQSGIFNAFSAPVTSQISVTAAFNAGWFGNDTAPFENTVQWQEGLGFEDRVNDKVSVLGGAEGFEVPGHDVAGFNVGLTLKPTKDFWTFISYRFQDPVDDSIDTVNEGLNQDIISASGGYQITDRLSLNGIVDRSFYSDGNARNFMHIEPAYMLWLPVQLRVGGAYEVIDYQKKSPFYSSPPWYQTFGPVVELEPYVCSWLSIHGRLEVPFVAQGSKWGTIWEVGPAMHLNDRFECSAEYLYCDVPGSYSNYSGGGFRVALSYRF